MTRILYTIALTACALSAAPTAQGQMLRIADAEPRWTELPVGFTASLAHARAHHVSTPYDSWATAALTEQILPVTPGRMLHTSGDERGTAGDYLLVPASRPSNAPVWLTDLHALRQTMLRSTTFQTPGMWVGIDPMSLRCTVKLEIAKVINVLD